LIEIPNVALPNEVHEFDFHMSNVGKDNPQGSFDCVQQTNSSSGASELICLGHIQNEITVCATSDSNVTTRKRMTQAEAELLNQSAKVIKPAGQFVGKSLQVRTVPQSIPGAVPKRKKSTHVNPANIIEETHTEIPVSQRPCRDRVIHLLALKSYKRPELFARLQKDGISQKDKNSFGPVLQQVARWNPKDNSYTLKSYIFKEIQKDWPGYSEADKQSLESILAGKFKMSHNATSSSCVQAGTSSSASQKRPLNPTFTGPLMCKKQKITDWTSQAQPSVSGWLSATREKAAVALPPPPAAPAVATPPPWVLPVTLLPVSNPPQTDTSSTSRGWGTQDRLVDIYSQSSSSIGKDQQQKYAFLTALGILVPDAVQGETSKTTGKKHEVLHEMPKQHEEKDASTTQGTTNVSKQAKDLREEETDQLEKCFCSDSELKETYAACRDHLSVITEEPDYFTKYLTVVSYEQYQRYKNDFTAQFDEYRKLRTQLETITKRCVEIGTKLHLFCPGSEDHQVKDKTVKSVFHLSPIPSKNYCAEKYRCDYLHKKLTHIRTLI
ncbi:ELL2 factor, partial [Rynchops niger]|nr:ELL2 factor [Rynchops niger]